MSRLTGNVAELPMAEFDMEGTAEVFRRAMEAMAGASQLPLTRVKVPAGGGRSFELPGMTADEPIVTARLEGVVLASAFVNAWWARDYGEGPNSAPDCASTDGISGWDADGLEHACRNCPRNRMGSKDGGRGKACRNMVQLLILLEGEALPIELRAPTMSVANWQSYVARQLVPRGLTPSQVVTRFTLAKATNSVGQDYSQVQFQAIGRVDDGQAASLLAAVRPMIAPTMGALLTEGEEA